ncbi:MAG: glycosyltransferase family 2 protein [Patescibacteria group bacterium]|nr:glycosyltransferase family 2 protein [Patescibacteria group bacterium]
MDKKIAIIMINYKYYAKRFLKKSYESLTELNYPKENYRVYVVDNVTTPETINLCKKLAPEAVIVPSKGNGWGHANNVGARKAIEDEFDDYFFFVNMDTEFHFDFLTEAVKAYESDEKIGIVQSKILLHPPVNEEYMLNSKGNSITFLGFGYCAGDGKKDDTGDKIIDIISAAGAGLLISKKLFLKAGMCDESYFMYHDDIELSFKIKLMGYRLVLAPKSIIYHKHEFGRAIMQIYYMERNRLRFLLEFFEIKTLLIIFPAWLFMEIGMLPYSILNKWFLTKLKVYYYFLNPKNIFLIYKKRKFVQNLKKINDRKIIKGMVGVIDFQQIENPVLKYIANPIFNLYWKAVKRFI